MILFFHFIRKNYNAYNGDNSKENLMFKNFIAKKFNKNVENQEVPANTIVLEALCAYKEKLVMADEIDFDKIVLTQMAIQDVWTKLPVNA